MPQMKSTHRGWTRVHQRQLCMLEICCLLMCAQAKFILARTSLFDLSQWSSGFPCSYVMYCLEEAVLRLPRTGYSVYPGVPYTLLVPSSKNIHQFLHPESSSSFCWDHLQPDFIISANGGSDHHRWCLPPTTPWLHASGATFFHAVRSNASAVR